MCICVCVCVCVLLLKGIAITQIFCLIIGYVTMIGEFFETIAKIWTFLSLVSSVFVIIGTFKQINVISSTEIWYQVSQTI